MRWFWSATPFLVAAGLVASAFFTLQGCTTASVQGSIASLEIGLTTAETAATVYAGLPLCGSQGATQVCASQSILAQIKTADDAAYSAIKSAEAIAAAGGNPNLTAAEAALTALQTLIPAIKGPSI
jgi:hypothetical protein